jgi:hypothetical protein
MYLYLYITGLVGCKGKKTGKEEVGVRQRVQQRYSRVRKRVTGLEKEKGRKDDRKEGGIVERRRG